MNYYRMGDTGSIGTRAEKLFKNIAKRKGWKVINSTRKEDMLKHYDFILEKKETTYKIDVKGPKRLCRNGDWLNDKVWIELKNVNGNPGWLYGESDFIAQQINKRFIILDRKKVINIVDKLVLDTYVTDPKLALLKKYKRRGRNDCMTLLPLSRLNSAIVSIWQV